MTSCTCSASSRWRRRRHYPRASPPRRPNLLVEPAVRRRDNPSIVTPPARQLIDTAIAHHRAGRLAEAELIYRQILEQDADQPDALHLLGLIAHQVGRSDVAEPLIRRAIELAPAS